MTNTISKNVTRTVLTNSKNKFIRCKMMIRYKIDDYILHKLLLVIILLFIICYYYTKSSSKQRPIGATTK